MPGRSVAELMEDTVSICLLHLRVNVVARISKLGNFLGQQLNPIHGVAKDDTLVDFQFGEQSVETMYLLSFFDVGVELGDTPEGEFVH